MERKISVDMKWRKKNKCDLIDCTYECNKCGFHPDVKAARLKKLFPNYVERKPEEWWK